MNTPDLKILFIGHDAKRTGAPTLLLNLLGYTKERKQSAIRILLRKSGPLADEFRQIAPTKTYFIQGIQVLTYLLRLNRLVQSFRIKMLLRQYKKEKFDLVYSNTIVNGDVLQALSELNCPVVTHVHELEKVIESFGKENWELVKQHTDHFIAGSNAIQEHLVSGRGVAREKIDVVHEFVPAFPEISIPNSRNEIRNKLGIPLDAFLVCGSGVCGERKGTDLFVRLAEIMQHRKSTSGIYFLWVGGWTGTTEGRHELEDFLDRKKLRGHVFFTGEVKDPLGYYAAADVFTLVSREDPFPLVCLLAASVGKPVLCFDKAGGMPEFVGDDCGYVVPYLDLEAFAERIFYLIDNPEELHSLGSAAREKVRKGHDTAVGAERIFRIIDKVLSDPNRRQTVYKNMNRSKASRLSPLPAANGCKWPMTGPSEADIPPSSSEVAWPKISIVTPSFNQGPYLEKTIRSVLLQDYPNLEYIVIDGGSTDNSVEIIKKYESWIDFWVSEKDRGQSHAINKGFKRATGDLLGWLNSDDYYAPNALKKVAEAYLANPSAGAIVGAGEMVDESGNVLVHTDAYDVTLRSLYKWIDRFFWQPSCLFTREAWENCGPLDENIHYAMDLDLWLKIAKAYKFGTVDAMLSVNLKHQHAKTSAFATLSQVDAAIVILKHGGESEARQYLLSTMINKDQQIEYLEKKFQEFTTSYSWKLTAPLRKIGQNKIIKRVTRFSSKAANNPNIAPYQAAIKQPLRENRPRIVHALENFMTGGSSRLVVDLFEHLGHCYEQEVITKTKPDPPAYVSLPVHDFSENTFEKAFSFFKKFRPDIVHIHFWEELSGTWYEQVFEAAKKSGSIVVENVNTPVKPYIAGFIDHYIYVSDYVFKTFGWPDGKSSVIYPGSNFDLFSRKDSLQVPDDTIGMVYRLEPDKLNESSIDVFIKTILRRPATRALIVGGGTYLDLYKKKVKDAGLADAFEFTDYVHYEKLPELYARMSIFVAPVWKESFGQVSPFAMNMGIPVVGYDIGALGEIIDNRELLAPPKDSGRLAEIIVDLLDNRERRLAIGRANQARAQKLFSVEAMVEAYAELYRKLLGEQP